MKPAAEVLRTLGRVAGLAVGGLVIAVAVLASALRLAQVPDTCAVASAIREGEPLPPPSTDGSPGVRISVVETGHGGGLEALVVHGGSFFRTARAEHAAFVVEHPQMTFLFDAGLGTNIDRQFAGMPWWAKPLFHYERRASAAEQLRAHGRPPEAIRTVVLSHLHWDHASGIEDFPNAEIVVAPEELSFAKGAEAKPPAFLSAQYAGARFRTFRFQDGAYGPFDRSERLVPGDDSVVFVPLGGHTPGSVGMLVRLRSGERLLFVGDLVWNVEGLRRPAPRSFIASALVDHDAASAFRAVEAVHAVAARNPGLVLVPTHDPWGAAKLPRFPAFTP